MYPQVWQRVVGRPVGSQKATLTGHQALCVAGHDFPGLVPTEKSITVAGLLFEGLTAHELAALDEYESSMYDRVTLKVTTSDQHQHEAYVYLVNESRRTQLTDEIWQPDPEQL